MIHPVERKTRENLHVFGTYYEKEIFQVTLPSKRKIRFYGPTYQKACNLATTSSWQNRETFLAQGATQEQLDIIGDFILVGPPVNEAMSIIRVYTLGMMQARYEQQDQRTKQNGIKLEEASKKQLTVQSKLYDLDWESLRIQT